MVRRELAEELVVNLVTLGLRITRVGLVFYIALCADTLELCWFFLLGRHVLWKHFRVLILRVEHQVRSGRRLFRGVDGSVKAIASLGRSTFFAGDVLDHRPS